MLAIYGFALLILKCWYFYLYLHLCSCSNINYCIHWGIGTSCSGFILPLSTPSKMCSTTCFILQTGSIYTLVSLAPNLVHFAKKLCSYSLASSFEWSCLPPLKFYGFSSCFSCLTPLYLTSPTSFIGLKGFELSRLLYIKSGKVFLKVNKCFLYPFSSLMCAAKCFCISFLNCGTIHLESSICCLVCDIDQYYTKFSYSSNLLLAHTWSKYLYLSNKSSNFVLVFHISFYIVITSKIAFSFSFYVLCLRNPFPTTIDFSCKICTHTSYWLYLSLFPTSTAKIPSLFPKPLSYVYTPSMFFDIVALFHSIPLHSSSTLAILSIEPSIPPTSSSSFILYGQL